MLELSVETSGMLALVQDPQFPAHYARVVRSAHRQAWREWAALKRGRVGLQARFGGAALASLDLTRRSRGYRRRQRRAFGEARPYESPSRSKPTALKMRGKMATEGVGWRVSLRNSTQEVTSRLFLPGAAVLNFAAQKNPAYRRELLGFDRNDADRKWLIDRIAELTQEGLDKLAARAAKKRAA